MIWLAEKNTEEESFKSWYPEELSQEQLREGFSLKTKDSSKAFYKSATTSPVDLDSNLLETLTRVK